MRALPLLCAALLCLLSSASAQVGAAKKSDARIKRLLEAADLQYGIDKDGDYKVVLTTKDSRTQVAWIRSKTEKLGDLEIREIWSVGVAADDSLEPKLLEKALRSNALVKLGAWQLQTWGQKEVLLFSAQIAADTDEASLRSTLSAVTSTADQLEAAHSDKDEF